MIGLQIRRRHHNLELLNLKALFGNNLLLWWDWTTEDSVVAAQDLSGNGINLEIHPSYDSPTIEIINGRRALCPVLPSTTPGGLRVNLSSMSKQITDTFSAVCIADIYTNTSSNWGGILYSFDDYLNGGWGFNCGYSSNDWSIGANVDGSNVTLSVPSMNGLGSALSKTRVALNVHGTAHNNRPLKTYVNASLGNSKSDGVSDVFKTINDIYIFFRDDDFTIPGAGVHEIFEIFFVNGDITQYSNYDLFLQYIQAKYPEVPWGIIPG